MAQEKISKLEIAKGPSFLKKYRVLFVAAGGLLALHIGWWRLVEVYVPVEERPKQFQYLAKLDIFRPREEEKE